MKRPRGVLHPAFGETHVLLDDPYAHAIFGFAFFFGVALARSATAWGTLLAHWRALAGLAALACAVMFAWHGLSDGTPVWEAARPLTRAVLAWSAILGLLGFAQTRRYHDGPVRRYLTEAIFPYYIAHQTIIIAAGFWLKQAGAQPELAFGVILLTTVFGWPPGDQPDIAAPARTIGGRELADKEFQLAFRALFTRVESCLHSQALRTFELPNVGFVGAKDERVVCGRGRWRRQQKKNQGAQKATGKAHGRNPFQEDAAS